jgi:flagellar motility protein MotE (MotC chaperone)
MEKSSMKVFKIFIIITFLVFSVNAAAEFFKYVDEDGNVHFTDDINQVPEAQRAKIHSYIESESEEPAEQEVTRENPSEQAATDQQTNLPDLSDDESESLEDAKKRIDALKSEIDQEYEALLKEKEQLAKAKNQAKTREQIIEFNKKVDSLNKRVASYEKKGKDYKAQVDAYNQRITGKNSENQSQ